jgi:tripartite-type tricarboxylate transporter receptor subunit TctC
MHRLRLPIAAALACLPLITFAQGTYPTKPVRVVVGFPPGGSTDIVARLLAPGLSEILGQQFVIENKPGANSNIGSEYVAKSAPDGHTISVVSASFSTNVSLYPNMGYDPVRDFAPITRVAAIHNVLVVNPTLKANTVKELVALVKANPGKIVFGSTGNGSTSHLSAEMFKTMVGGMDTIHVPYKGAGPAYIDLIAGQTNAMFALELSVAPFVKSGKIRPIAAASAKRTAASPDLPTFAEAGFPGFEATSWIAMVAPAATSGDIINRLNAATARVIQSPSVREKFATQGAEPVGDSPPEFAAYLRSEVAKWAKVVKASGARID